MPPELRVLVVEDDDTVREVLSARIDDWGYPSRAAADAEEAERLLRSFDPEIVVTDLVLPDGNGLDLLERIKEAPNGRDRTVFVMTGHGSVDTAVEAMKRGARDFLTKPLDTDRLRALMDAAGEERAAKGRIERSDDAWSPEEDGPD